ncbi:MAG: UDP-3-O-(3-hydroxymyristoyl)glucosamine N-acyltransferase [Verrucomicrobia bacterium GWC2_42_7]|nr:MAG: UDP-3-O-(3-hydroxymyristoyl)glucosamine N-acyltransferase [Verrucomicrobia bacterium GWC2_42_7]
MNISFSVEELLAITSPSRTQGDLKIQITGIAALDKAQKGDLSFLGNQKYKHEVPTSKASVLLLPEDFAEEPKPDQLFVHVKNPSFALGQICRVIESKLWPKREPSIHPSAIIAESAQIAKSAYIGPYCVIGEGAIIGENAILESQISIGRHVIIGDKAWLAPHVSIYDFSKIGTGVRIHSGAVIGSDGFGYETVNGIHEKIPQVGCVVIENDVEIGANTTIDRARFAETRIGQGTKIDNLVQIAHNVSIGKNCFIVALAGISGSTVIEDYVVVAGQAGIAGHLHIGKGVMIGGQSGVNHSIPAGSFVRGAPALPHMQANRIDILKKQLPELFKRISTIEETIKKLSPSCE